MDGARTRNAAALLGQRLDLIGPDPGRVDHDVAMDVGGGTVLGVADRHTDDPVALAQQRDHLGRGPYHRAVVRRGSRDRHGVPGQHPFHIAIKDRMRLPAGERKNGTGR